MARNTILLRGNAREEGGIATSSTITPGSFVVMSGTGEGWALAGASAVGPIAVARENHENNGDNISDVIAQNSTFTVIFPEWGAKINARTTDTIARGDEVTWAAAGRVALRDSGDALLGIAASASDLTAGRVEIIIGGAKPAE